MDASLLQDGLFGPITQLGYLTDDIEAAALMWTKTSGIGPWTLMPNVTMAATMDGQPSDIKIDIALAYKGDMQIELIKPLCDTPSPYTAHKEAGLWGLHHVQFTTSNMEASLELAKSAGLEVACEINQGGGVYNYLRGPAIWFELMFATEGLLAFYDMIKSASTDWDGKDVIRELAL